MNVMIDTNIILDDILGRAPNAENAKKISQLVTDEYINGYLTASSLTDIFYIVSKKRNDVIAKKVIKNLLLSFMVISVDVHDCQRAVDSSMRDFEDALVIVCAEKAALNYIITNDKGFLSAIDSNIPMVNPIDFLLKYNN